MKITKLLITKFKKGGWDYGRGRSKNAKVRKHLRRQAKRGIKGRYPKIELE
jgi:hypothetical protein